MIIIRYFAFLSGLWFCWGCSHYHTGHVPDLEPNRKGQFEVHEGHLCFTDTTAYPVVYRYEMEQNANQLMSFQELRTGDHCLLLPDKMTEGVMSRNFLKVTLQKGHHTPPEWQPWVEVYLRWNHAIDGFEIVGLRWD